MRIITNEIKKLLNIKTIIMISAIFFIIWSVFIGSSYIKYFPQGTPDLPHFNISNEMLEVYGETIDEKEWDSFVSDTKKLEKEADIYLQNHSDANILGITSYRKFRDSFEKGVNVYDEIIKLHNKIMWEEENYLFWELGEREYLIDRYAQKEEWISYRISQDNRKQVARYYEVIKSENSNSVLNFVVFRNYNWIIGWFAIILIITVAFAVSPIFIDDEKSKTNYVQYITKIGRGLSTKKIIAAIITSFLITTVEIALLFIMYSKNNTLQFWNCSINGIFSDITSWFDITFGQYMIITILILYIISFIVCSLSIYVSTKAKNYISLIGIQLPILGLLIAFVKALGINEITKIGFPKYLLHISYSGLIIVSVMLICLVIRKEKIRDIK